MKDKQKIYSEKCKICGKIISSLSLTQFNYNYQAHVIACKMKKEREEK